MNIECFSPRQVCWLSQQTAEKALKAALLLDAVKFPHVHDLNILRELLPKGWNVLDTHRELFNLTEWAVEARYPGDWPEPTNTDAKYVESTARLIYDSVAVEFRRRGILI